MTLFLSYSVSFLLRLSFAVHPIVVVDAGRKTPVEAVEVQADGQTLYTDEWGRVGLPADYHTLSFTRLGYTTLRLSAPLLAKEDTVFLQPSAQALSEVVVRPPGPPVALTSAGKKITAPNPAYPGTQIAIWFALPDSSRSFRLRGVSIPVKEKFNAGRVRLSIHAKGEKSTLLNVNLLPENILLTADAVAGTKSPKLEFDASAYNLILPATGFYLVLECVTASAAEEMQQTRIDSKKGPNQQGVSKGTAFVETSVATKTGETFTQSTAVEEYPQFMTSPVEGPASSTWRRYLPKVPLRQIVAGQIGSKQFRAYNIVAVATIEPQ